MVYVRFYGREITNYTVIYGAYIWCTYCFMAGKSPTTRSYTVHIYDTGQPYECDMNVGFDECCHFLPWSNRKNGLIKQFLKDVNWGELDYLIVDAPPGTSDEHITIAQCLQASGPADGAVIVTTPQVW